jgi:hypothetical protein
VPENVQLSQAAPDSATAPSGMTVAQRGAWVAVGNVTASCCGSASGSLSFEEEVCSAFARLSGASMTCPPGGLFRYALTLRSSLDALAAHHLSLAHLAHLNLSLASQADFAPLNALYARLFGSDPPSRACIALDDVPGGARVTIDAVAMDDGVRYADGVPQGKPNRERRVTHVQGRSYWAAANIGPYSQAVKVSPCISAAAAASPRQADSMADARPTDASSSRAKSASCPRLSSWPMMRQHKLPSRFNTHAVSST